MSPFAFADAPVPIPDFIAAAHRGAWERLARPGAWWSGAERVAIAAEARRAPDCELCRERKAALSPLAVAGEHVEAGGLSADAVDVIHRVVTDPGRLTKSWLDGILAGGLSDTHYVELIGIVVSVLSIDVFHRGLGMALEPLPAPEPGEPGRVRPSGARPGVAWVPMLRGGTGNVVRALSLVPEAVEELKSLSAAHYLPMPDVGNPGVGMPGLSRSQVELIAGRVSALNECFY